MLMLKKKWQKILQEILWTPKLSLLQTSVKMSKTSFQKSFILREEILHKMKLTNLYSTPVSKNIHIQAKFLTFGESVMVLNIYN